MFGVLCAVVLTILFLSGGLQFWALSAGVAMIALVLVFFLVLTAEQAEWTQGQQKTQALSNGAALELTNREFRAVLVSALSEPCLFVDPAGRVEASNTAARKSFRFVGEQPILSAVVRRPEMLTAVNDARLTGESHSFTFVERGEMDRHYACVASPVRTNSGLGVLITMHDLTEVKRAERARADFLANASHELRTPLTSLAGFIETMRGPAKDDHEAWDHFLEIMQGQAERMRRLINDLLSLSRIELSEHRRPDTNADLAAVVSEVGDALAPVASEKGVTIRIMGPSAGLMVTGVRDELAQVAQNLIDNAIKYSETDDVVEVELVAGLNRDEAIQMAGRRLSGASRMAIATSVFSPGSRYAILRVVDSGPGIDRKYLPRLSERFYRVDPGRGLRRGTGLGLAIVKHIVTRHRGDFLVESIVDVGTAFGVILPLSGSDDASATVFNTTTGPPEEQFED